MAHFTFSMRTRWRPDAWRLSQCREEARRGPEQFFDDDGVLGVCRRRFFWGWKHLVGCGLCKRIIKRIGKESHEKSRVFQHPGWLKVVKNQVLQTSLLSWMVVSNIFYFHPENWRRWTHFDEHIFQRGWFNHQLVKLYTHIPTPFGRHLLQRRFETSNKFGPQFPSNKCHLIFPIFPVEYYWVVFWVFWTSLRCNVYRNASSKRSSLERWGKPWDLKNRDFFDRFPLVVSWNLWHWNWKFTSWKLWGRSQSKNISRVNLKCTLILESSRLLNVVTQYYTYMGVSLNGGPPKPPQNDDF